jgi:hypothetical protein
VYNNDQIKIQYQHNLYDAYNTENDHVLHLDNHISTSNILKINKKVIDNSNSVRKASINDFNSIFNHRYILDVIHFFLMVGEIVVNFVFKILLSELLSIGMFSLTTIRQIW